MSGQNLDAEWWREGYPEEWEKRLTNRILKSNPDPHYFIQNADRSVLSGQMFFFVDQDDNPHAWPCIMCGAWITIDYCRWCGTLNSPDFGEDGGS